MYWLKRLFTYVYWYTIIKHWWQRRTRGFDDSETWSLDITISEFILPRLKRFRELHDKALHPPDTLSEDEWRDIMDKIIVAHELVISETLAREKEINDGLILFAKYYRHLWW